MPLNQNTSHGTQPPPSSSKTGHPLPRRASPANSVTLRHHRLARDASLKASQGSGPAVKTTTTTSPRRNSSGDSNETGQSDPNTWFDQSNQNPTATFDSNVMEGKQLKLQEGNKQHIDSIDSRSSFLPKRIRLLKRR
jgi:hypothetical protein